MAGGTPAPRRMPTNNPKMTRVNSSPPRFAALDLGSLTVRLAIAEKSPSGGCRILLHRREITGLGQGLAQTGDLAPEGMDRTFQALQVFGQVMADYQVERYRAVATHAVRAAGNGAAFLERLRAELRSLRRSPASGGGGPPVPPRGAFRPGGKIFADPDPGLRRGRRQLRVRPGAAGAGAQIRQPAPGGPHPEPGPAPG